MLVFETNTYTHAQKIYPKLHSKPFDYLVYIRVYRYHISAFNLIYDWIIANA